MITDDRNELPTRDRRNLVRFFPIASASAIVALTALAIVLAQHLGVGIGKPADAYTTVPDVCTLSSPAIMPYASLIQARTPGATTTPSVLTSPDTGSLLTDCNSLLAVKGSLQTSASSTAVFNDWSASANMHSWSGVAV